MNTREVMLFIFGGLPGVGKSTLARALACRWGAAYLRIDTIEQALGRKARSEVGEQGYMVAYEVALDNLRAGTDVVADSANTIELTRAAWREVARKSECRYREIEVICSDRGEHQARVERRLRQEGSSNLPTWSQVLHRLYEPWQGEHLIIDTAGRTVEDAVHVLLAELEVDGGATVK